MRLGRIVLVLVVLLGACDRRGTFSEPQRLDTCEDLARATAELFQAEIDAMEALPLEKVLAQPAPPELAEFEVDAAALTARAAVLGCSDAELRPLIGARLGSLHGTGPVAERFLSLIKARFGVAP